MAVGRHPVEVVIVGLVNGARNYVYTWIRSFMSDPYICTAALSEMCNGAAVMSLAVLALL